MVGESERKRPSGTEIREFIYVSKPWSYKEGLVIGAGLLVIGLLLQMTVEPYIGDLFARPVNVIVLVVYIIALVAMHLLRKRVYLFGWLSHYSAVSVLCRWSA